MAAILIQFGQCGNQLGDSLLRLVYEDTHAKNTTLQQIDSDYRNLSKSLWFSESRLKKLYARSILVDTENKVVNFIRDRKKSYILNHIVCSSEGGSASNWAYGYNNKSRVLEDDVLDNIRYYAEELDNADNFLCLLGLGGGTGSGVGTRIIEDIKAEYPTKNLIVASVFPFEEGEVATQSYNTLLTLTKIYDVVDGIISFENSKIYDVCTKEMPNKKIDLNHMNTIIAKNLATTFQPLSVDVFHQFSGHLTAHPSYKFVQLKSTPYFKSQNASFEADISWDELVSQVKSSLRYYTQEKIEPNGKNTKVQRSRLVYKLAKSVANMLVTRGGIPPSKKNVDHLLDPDMYVHWVKASEEKFKNYHQPRQMCDSDKILSFASNDSCILKTLVNTNDHAKKMYSFRAYAHHFDKYEVEEEDFRQAFAKLDDIIDCYKKM